MSKRTITISLDWFVGYGGNGEPIFNLPEGIRKRIAKEYAATSGTKWWEEKRKNPCRCGCGCCNPERT